VRDGDRELRLGGPKQRGLLALLLLRANEVVSADRLLDELWDGAPPDEQALHAHVSRLRKVLEPEGGREVLVTRPPGYELRLEPDQLDLLRFEALLERARTELDGDRPSAAAEMLREALSLWRGRPLADLEDEPLYRLAADRLDGVWLDALELRVEADLQLGRHAGLVKELRALVRRHPFREGLRAQLMLALYRCDRQADALEAYAEGHRHMTDELGLDPGPRLRRLQEQILTQDPALDHKRPLRHSSPRRRSGALLLVAAVGAFAGVVISGGGGDGASPTNASAGNVAIIDAATGRTRERVAVGDSPSTIALGEGAAWIVDADAQTVSRLDERSNAVSTFAIGATPTDVAVGSGSVWIGSGSPSKGAQFTGALTTGLVRVDPGTQTIRARVTLPRARRGVSNAREGAIAVEPGAVWAIAPDGALARIDPRTARVVAVIRGVQARAVAAGPEGVWLLGEDGTIARVDRERNLIAQRRRIPASAVTALATGGGAVWVTAPGDGALWRIDPGERLLMRTIDLGPGAADVAYGNGSVWVANPLRGTVTRVDPGRNAVARTLTVGGAPRSLTVDGSAAWVATTGSATPSSASAGTLPENVCGPLLSAGGETDLQVVADLPLQGGLAFSTQQMEQAIAFTLRRRGFRAGRFRLGYQACDHSVARTGLFDEAKCTGNARRFVAAEPVVGVIGFVNSPCAMAALPQLDRAGLATVSPLASYVGLTRPAPGAPPDELDRLHPSGTRTFARVFPADDHQGRALARVAVDLGARTVAVIDDGDPPYGALLAGAFAAEARAAGLDVTRARFDPQARDYRALAGRVARAAPDAVFVGGFLNASGARVVRALRARLNPNVALLLPDGFTPLPLLREQAGSAAEGAYVAINGLIVETLGPSADDFVGRFQATQPGLPVDPSAVYAAQAAEVMIDAITRSDGTRESVARALLDTRLRGSLLGDVRFDANGDVRSPPVTVLRMRAGARDLEDWPGATLDRVVR